MTFFISYVNVKHGGEASYRGYQMPGYIRSIPPVQVSVAGTARGKGCGRVHVLVGHPSGWLVPLAGDFGHAMHCSPKPQA